jgi:hypothetical protein
VGAEVDRRCRFNALCALRFRPTQRFLQIFERETGGAFSASTPSRRPPCPPRRTFRMGMACVEIVEAELCDRTKRPAHGTPSLERIH